MVIGPFSKAWTMKLEMAQPSCDCMLGPQAVRDAPSIDQYFRFFAAFDRLVSFARQRGSPAAR